MYDSKHMKTEHAAFIALKKTIDSYAPLSTRTWNALIDFCEFKTIEKQSVLYASSEVPASFAFVYSGLFRCFVHDSNGNEYNKIFFDAGSFPGAMTALLTTSPSQLTIESLEPSLIISINFKAYRELLYATNDLMLFHILYLEKNWLLAKDAREIEIVQQNASQRYQQFLQDHPSLSSRIPQYHIASHLGITPTQLSRIRKKT